MYSLYSEMVKKVESRPFNILRGIKTLALSNDKYSTFCKSTTNSVSSPNFKLLKEKINLKKHNFKFLSNKMISLNKVTFTTLNKNKKSKLLRANSQCINRKINLNDKNKKKKNIYFFVGENRYTGDKKNCYKNKKNKNICLKLNDEFFKEKLEILTAERKVKDFFVLLDSIFYEENYYDDNLKYWEKDIFGHKDEYVNYLKDELNYYINKEKKFHMKYEFYKLFELEKYGKIDLYLKPAKIEITDIFNKNILTISLPFNLMILLFLCNAKQMNEIILILLQSLNIKEILNDPSKENNIDDEIKKKVILNLISKLKIEKGKLKFNLEQKDFEKYYSKLNFIEKTKGTSDSGKYRTFLNKFYKEQNIIKIIDKSHLSISYKNYIFKNNTKINFETNLNKYQLYLINEKNIYNINLIFPEIIFEFKSQKERMNRYINKELFLYLHQNNFMNWDFYILHYLYSFKYVRRIMSGIFSVRNNTNNRILTPKNDIIFYNNKENIMFNNNKHNIIDDNITTMTFDKKKFEYIFLLFSDAINLNLFTLKSYIMYAFFVNVKKPVIFEFHFNFIHMRILYIISLFDKLEIFLKKLLYIKNGEINFDYSYFDIFAKMTNHNIKNYLHNIFLSKHENEKENQINITQEKEKETSFKDSISIKIVEPFIEVLTINEIKNSYKAIQSNIKLKKQFIEELIKNDINNWIEVIKKYKNELGIKYHVKYEEAQNQKQKIRKKISVYNSMNNKRFSKQSINNLNIG